MSHPSGLGFTLCAGVLALVTAAPAQGQFSQAPTVPPSMVDSPALKPPAGASVAIVEFADLECPACRAANPTISSAATKYRVPWQFHDFPIPGHVWSLQAAVNARWFSEKSKELAEQYRSTIFAEQNSIATQDDLNQATQKFAADHHIQLPFVIDPQGRLLGEVRADADLARSLGVNRTPTIFVVTAHSHDPGHPFVQITDVQMLYAYLDQAVSATAAPKTASASTHRSRGGQ